MSVRLSVLLALAFWFCVPHAACGDNRHAIEQGYRRIATAIQSKNLPAFLKENYTWRNPDGTQPSPQELRSVWQANFATIKTYAAVSFALERLTISGRQATARTRRTVFFLPNGFEEEQMEISRSLDRWEKVHSHWRFVVREALPGALTGRVVGNSRPMPDSPRLKTLWRSVRSGQPGALPTFWREMRGKAPLIEPISGDPTHFRVTFLWQGGTDTFREVRLRGGLPSEEAKPLIPLPGTNVWYRTERLPADARFAYSLWVTTRVRRPTARASAHIVWAEIYPPDPLNPRTINDGPYVELPKAPPQPWRFPRSGVRKGMLAQESVISALLKEARPVTVYTPAGYAQGDMPCRLLILFDGEDYQNLIPTPLLLDNLIARGKIAPTVALLLRAQGTRFRDLRCSSAFADFVATELVPWARARYRIRLGPQHVTIGGLSLGGLMAGYCGLRHPQIFGNVLSQSGAFWYGKPEQASGVSQKVEDGWLAQQFAMTPRLPVRFWMEVGRLESEGMIANNRRLRDVLTAKEYNVTYTEFTGGHDYLHWRGSLADALIALTGSERASP